MAGLGAVAERDWQLLLRAGQGAQRACPTNPQCPQLPQTALVAAFSCTHAYS